MKRRLYAPAVLLVGLLSAQIVATAHVYLSNLDLLQATETLMRNGYLTIPNEKVARQLDLLSTAMAGGTFFTLSIGAAFSLLTMMAVWIWDRVFLRQWRFGLLCMLVWICTAILINEDGWNTVATAYCIVVPMVSGVAAIQLLPVRTTLISPSGVLWPISAAIILALMWSLVLDNRMFTNIRDHLLLTSDQGKAITDAYYAWTLYPAEAFRSLDQKQIRTCILDQSLDKEEINRLEVTLRQREYLPVPIGNPADLTIGRTPQRPGFFLFNSHRKGIRVSESELRHSPDKVLADYSYALDNHRTLRKLTYFCLLLGLPLVLFTFLFNFLAGLPNLFLTVNLSNIIAAILSVLVGGWLLLPVYRAHTISLEGENPLTALTAASPDVRIAALKQAYENRHDISLLARRLGLDKSPNIAERYWLARSLAYATSADAAPMLSTLASDPTPIVVCQALWAMGQRANTAAIPEIITRIQASSHWYIQMYAYRALRKLGWEQPQSARYAY